MPLSIELEEEKKNEYVQHIITDILPNIDEKQTFTSAYVGTMLIEKFEELAADAREYGMFHIEFLAIDLLQELIDMKLIVYNIRNYIKVSSEEII